MFDKKNQENINKINEEFEAIKESILSIIESVSINGKEINPHLDAIDRRLDKLDAYLDSVSTRWVSKNSGLEEMRGYIRKLNILFNGLVKDMYDKAEKAKKKGKKFVVPEKKALALRGKWNDFSKRLKEKNQIAAEKREKARVRKAKLQTMFLPLNFDAKEDAIVNERVQENSQYKKDRDIVVKSIADYFKVEYEAICKWPDEKLIATAEIISGKQTENKENTQSFE
ncbi:MAG: hypothetical protein IKJ33_05260 [Clostridia bacterium]|nr:hypothetical protein [Clostridia bacterium]